MNAQQWAQGIPGELKYDKSNYRQPVASHADVFRGSSLVPPLFAYSLFSISLGWSSMGYSLYIMAFTVNLRPTWVPFSGFRYTSNNLRLRSVGDNDQRLKRFCSNTVHALRKFQVTGGQNARDEIVLCVFHSVKAQWNDGCAITTWTWFRVCRSALILACSKRSDSGERCEVKKAPPTIGTPGTGYSNPGLKSLFRFCILPSYVLLRATFCVIITELYFEVKA